MKKLYSEKYVYLKIHTFEFVSALPLGIRCHKNNNKYITPLKNQILAYLFCFFGVVSSFGLGFYQDISSEVANELMRSGYSLARNGDFKKAEEKFKEAHEEALRSENHPLATQAGLVYLSIYAKHTNGDIDSSRKFATNLYKRCLTKKDTLGMARTIGALGHVEEIAGNYLSALNHYTKSIDLAHLTKDMSFQWRSHFTMGVFIKQLGDSELARKEFKKLFQYDSDPESRLNERYAYINISSSFENPDSIIYYADKVLKICEERPHANTKNLAIYNKAWGLNLQEKPEEAIQLIQDHIDLDKLDKNRSSYGPFTHTIGSAYLKIKRYQKAIYFLNESITKLKKDNNLNSLIIAQEDLSACYEGLGNLKESLALLKGIKPWREKLNEVSIKKEIAKIESQKLLASKEVVISKLEAKNKKIGEAMYKSQLFNYLLISFVLIALLLFLYWRQRTRAQYFDVKKQLSINKMKSLRAVMNPHFLFNSFSTLQNYVLKNDAKKATSYMAQLSEMIRGVLASTDSMFTKFNDEIDLLKLYVHLEHERFQEKFQVNFEVDPKLQEINPKIPAMIIQPIIENAIIHGFGTSEPDLKLDVRFQLEGQKIKGIIRDNGIGREAAQQRKKLNKHVSNLSISVENTADRIRLLKKLNKYEASINIQDVYDDEGNPDGTEVSLILPLQNQSNEL